MSKQTDIIVRNSIFRTFCDFEVRNSIVFTIKYSLKCIVNGSYWGPLMIAQINILG